MSRKLIRDIIKAFNAASDILVTTHMDPDGDSLGSQLVMREYLSSLGKRVVMCSEGTIPGRYQFMQGIEEVRTDPDIVELRPDLALVLESTSLDRIGRVRRLIGSGCKVVNIDHHIGNSFYGDINLIDEGASSVAEILYRVLTEARFSFTKAAAENLYTAILTDTGRFHFSSTTPESLRICADLIGAGVNPREITDKIYFSKTLREMEVIGEVICSAQLELDGKLCALTLSERMIENTGLDFSDFEGIVDYSMYLKGVIIGVLFKEVSEGITKISLRSRDSFDVSLLAKRFGGGGHSNAAGATIDMPLVRARARVYEIAAEMLNGHRT